MTCKEMKILKMILSFTHSWRSKKNHGSKGEKRLVFVREVRKRDKM